MSVEEIQLIRQEIARLRGVRDELKQTLALRKRTLADIQSDNLAASLGFSSTQRFNAPPPLSSDFRRTSLYSPPSPPPPRASPPPPFQAAFGRTSLFDPLPATAQTERKSSPPPPFQTAYSSMDIFDDAKTSPPQPFSRSNVSPATETKRPSFQPFQAAQETKRPPGPSLSRRPGAQERAQAAAEISDAYLRTANVRHDEAQWNALDQTVRSRCLRDHKSGLVSDEAYQTQTVKESICALQQGLQGSRSQGRRVVGTVITPDKCSPPGDRPPWFTDRRNRFGPETVRILDEFDKVVTYVRGQDQSSCREDMGRLTRELYE